ncbi:hypothetical protein EWM64_g2365 [Hericium alpestre]|uniref:Uncharacterized protein n=1 Tax=Hericium alpestre TaxID=135208 RepID=A0A4Z0A3P3_9AGAM|nr:hypothetical protein EWM64_g2365 [Hericium alpestre]
MRLAQDVALDIGDGKHAGRVAVSTEYVAVIPLSGLRSGSHAARTFARRYATRRRRRRWLRLRNDSPTLYPTIHDTATRLGPVCFLYARPTRTRDRNAEFACARPAGWTLRSTSATANALLDVSQLKRYRTWLLSLRAAVALDFTPGLSLAVARQDTDAAYAETRRQSSNGQRVVWPTTRGCARRLWQATWPTPSTHGWKGRISMPRKQQQQPPSCAYARYAPTPLRMT